MKKTTPTRTQNQRKRLILIFAVVSLAAGTYHLIHHWPPSRAELQLKCDDNFRQLQTGLLFFSGDYEGKLPENLRDCAAKGYLGGDMRDRLYCPLDDVPYFYVGNGFSMLKNSPMLPVVIESPQAHSGESHVLLLNGTVRRIQLHQAQPLETQLEQLLDGAEITGKERELLLLNIREAQ